MGEYPISTDKITKINNSNGIQKFGIPFVDLDKYFIDPEVPRIIPENLAQKHKILPIKIDGDKLYIAMSDPLNILAIDDIELVSKLKVIQVLTTEEAIINGIEKYYSKESAKRAIEDFQKEYGINNILSKEEKLFNDIKRAPIVRLINSIISQATKNNASDIHIEPNENNIRLRFRIDGQLQEVMILSKSVHNAIVTRIKIMANMDIAEKRKPQDGRIETKFSDRDLDLRISTLPTIYGEKIVIRILNKNTFLMSRCQLGFTDKNMKIFDNVFENSHGIILVTGPTGSGKSTTLYTVLRELNYEYKNIITIEDPVEYKLEGINQVQVNEKAGLTFANGLRSILRQDPDIIMVGEIRDEETAKIAVRAAITGHLVLSTLHTNDASSTIARLVDMGIERYLVSASIVGVMAQRLVRKICNNCRTIYNPTFKEKELLEQYQQENITLYKGEGCFLCNNSGYKGRTAIHEIMIVTKDHRLIIEDDGNIDKLRNLSIKNGMMTLKQNCIELIKKGETTIEELIRVTYTV